MAENDALIARPYSVRVVTRSFFFFHRWSHFCTKFLILIPKAWQIWVFLAHSNGALGSLIPQNTANPDLMACELWSRGCDHTSYPSPHVTESSKFLMLESGIQWSGIRNPHWSGIRNPLKFGIRNPLLNRCENRFQKKKKKKLTKSCSDSKNNENEVETTQERRIRR